MFLVHSATQTRFTSYYVIIADSQEDYNKASERFYLQYPVNPYGSSVDPPTLINGLYIGNAKASNSSD